LLKLSVRDRFSLPVFEKQINDEVAMDTVSRKTDEHTQIADRPNNVSEASLHGSFRSCQWLRQQGRHDAVSSMCVKSKKIVRLALKMAIVVRKKHPGIVQRVRMFCSLSIFVIASATGLVRPVMAQEEPLTEQGYEREELGANPYTVPSIARIFQQLDELRPLPFEQLQREFSKASPIELDF